MTSGQINICIYNFWDITEIVRYRFYVKSCVLSPFIKRMLPLYARPILDYNSDIWSPYSKYDIECNENLNIWHHGQC